MVFRLTSLAARLKSRSCAVHTAGSPPTLSSARLGVLRCGGANFSTSFPASRWLTPGSPVRGAARASPVSVSAPRGRALLRGGCAAVGAAVLVAAASASLHCSPVSAMAARSGTVDLDSPKSDWREAKRYLSSLSQEERRRLYRTQDYLSLEDIPVWKPKGTSPGQALYSSDQALTAKVSLLRGDITRLELDAVVNAANKTLLGGGGVDGALHRAAGPLLKQECGTLGGCETSQAKLTSGYKLPAKTVIHTVGPIVQAGSVGGAERQALRSCYWNCLQTATQHQLRTVAFPCISTGVYGYPPSEAVDVALKTVREYLDTHDAQLDRVVFCVFLQSDEQLYQDRLPLYFPPAD
ncbi:ADP-ribose glycohydrolase MACROD1 isoform X2 [Amia ocellicauda]|uniref:ADP-ribose glycohydrolase MACROD1 isoform X2 n=1 Tax=Amia ocellicauda TaxID=2972642 RepID=UPI003464303A